MSLLSAMQNLIQVCQLCGIVPISADSKNRKWELNRSLEVLTIFVLFFNWTIIMIFFIIPKRSAMESTNNMRITVNIFWLTMIYVQSSAVLLEAFFNRRQHKKLLTILGKLESIFQNHLKKNLDLHRVKQAALKAIWIWVFQAFVFLSVTFFIFCFIVKEFFAIRFLLFATLASIINELHLAYVAFLMSVIQENLNVLTIYAKPKIKENGFYLRHNGMLGKSHVEIVIKQ